MDITGPCHVGCRARARGGEEQERECLTVVRVNLPEFNYFRMLETLKSFGCGDDAATALFHDLSAAG